MGYNAQELVRKLPREIKLTANSHRLLDYLAFCANEKDAEKNGVYSTFPSEDRILSELHFSSATMYRSLDELEYRCGFYLITRRDCKDRRSALYDLHIYADDLQPDAIAARKQAADARLSAARGKVGVRKRITSQNERCLPNITSHSERCLPDITSQNETQHLSKREVITSQNETQNKEYKRTRNLNQERNREKGGGGTAPSPPKKINPQNPKTARSRRPAQPEPVQTVLDTHAEMWTACVHFSQGYPLPDKFETPEANALMNDGVKHVGGWVRFHGFKARPQDASFAQDKFLDYCRRHDPAYAQAVEQTVQGALTGKAVPKAKAAGRGSSRGP